MSGRFPAIVLACALCASAQSPPDAATSYQSLLESYHRIRSLLENGAAAEALSLARDSRERAVRGGRRDFELLFLNAAVNAHAAQHDLRSALAAAQQALRLARELGQPDGEAAVCGMLAHLYVQQGQYDSAWSIASQAAKLGRKLSPTVHNRLLIEMATVKFKLGDPRAGIAFFRSAMGEAERAGDYAALADAWDQLGHQLLESGDLPAAERALTEGFRMRRMRGDRGIDSSLRSLGMLKIAVGDARTARALLDRAVQLIESGRSRIQPWSVYYHRALARRALGDLEGALADFARTFELARRLRADLVPVDQVQSYTDVRFRRFYSDYVDTGMELYARRPSRALAAEMFIVSEENRASGLRQTSGWREALPERYWALIGELRALSIASLAGVFSPQAAIRMRRVEAELAQMESAAGLSTASNSSERKSAQSTLSLFQASLRAGEVLLSFHLGEARSFVWALTKHGLQVRRIPARSPIAETVRQFRHAVAEGGAATDPGRRLSHDLFGQLSPAVRQAADWVLVLDDALFQLPFAALPVGSEYLVERHSVRLLPSAFMLAAARRVEPRHGFVAFGDPLYNRADPRRRASVASRDRANTLRAAGPELEFARIPASGTEARECARQWKSGSAVVLTGAQATRAGLEAVLGGRPAALHMAVHIVGSDDGSRALIALGLDSAGNPDFLDAFEISRKRYGVPMVVLSGCSSGRGRVLPGAGLTGLTRAWLLSGSQAVTASHWPTSDDTGALFTAFYRSVARSSGTLSASLCARALRTAQLEMLNSGSWRAQPRYWAAFFVTGRD